MSSRSPALWRCCSANAITQVAKSYTSGGIGTGYGGELASFSFTTTGEPLFIQASCAIENLSGTLPDVCFFTLKQDGSAIAGCESFYKGTGYAFDYFIANIAIQPAAGTYTFSFEGSGSLPNWDFKKRFLSISEFKR